MSKDNMSFEKALGELEKISGQLQSEDVSLDDAIALFEEGIKLSKVCAEKLETAKQKIEKLTADGSDSDD